MIMDVAQGVKGMTRGVRGVGDDVDDAVCVSWPCCGAGHHGCHVMQ